MSLIPTPHYDSPSIMALRGFPSFPQSSARLSYPPLLLCEQPKEYHLHMGRNRSVTACTSNSAGSSWSLVDPKLVLQESHYWCQSMGWSHQTNPNHWEGALWCSVMFTGAEQLHFHYKPDKGLIQCSVQASRDVTLFITCSSGHQCCWELLNLIQAI